MSWSVSKSWLWTTCPRQYLLAHVLKATPTSPLSSDREFGILVHHGLEAAFSARAASRVGESGCDTMRAYLPFALDAIRDFTGEATLRVRRDVARVVARVLDGIQLPAPAAILGVEKRFSLVIDGITVNGVMDYVVRTGPNSLHVRDWKTGKITSDPEDLESNMQLAIYTLAAFLIWRWAAKITVGLYSATKCVETPRALDASSVEFFRDRIVADARDAEAADDAVTIHTVDVTHPAKPGPHCGRCPFQTYCPVFADADLPTRRGVDVETERKRAESALALRG